MSFLLPIAKAAAPTLIKAGAGFLADKFSRRNQTGGVAGFTPPGFRAGGLSGQFDAGQFSVSPDPGRTALVGDISRTFPQQANLVRGLRQQVTPGFGRLTEARLAGIGDRARRAIGNLRENLARRRVLGSSFAQDALARAEREFAREEADVRAQSFLEELQLTNELIQQEFGLRRNEFQTQLDELNLQAEVASQLSQGATGQLAANARLKEQLNAQSAAATGRFFGSVGGDLSRGFQRFIDRQSIGPFSTEVIPA